MRIASGAEALLDLSQSIVRESSCPQPEKLLKLLDEGIRSLSSESVDARPHASSGEPGGIVWVSTPLVAIVPDLHARTALLSDLLASFLPSRPHSRIIDLILNGHLTLICLGDVFNTEGKLGAERWTRAARKIESMPGAEGVLSGEMEEEMGASLATLCLVITLKRELAGGFHCLKGNHDNGTNTNLDGDSAFFKFALEGAMGAEWLRLRYGEETMRTLRRYERLLPLVAAGNSFCASHAEPAFALSIEDLIEYRTRPDIVRALIWTDNGKAEDGSVRESLSSILGPAVAEESGFWLSGHRPVAGTHRLRAKGRLVQIHNAERRQIAWIDNDPRAPKGLIDLYEIGDRKKELSLLETVALFSSVPS
jgi:hypothetical protein